MASSRKGPEGHGQGGEEPGRESRHLHSWERLRLEAEIQKSPQGDAGCIWEEEGAVTEEYVLKGEKSAKARTLEDGGENARPQRTNSTGMAEGQAAVSTPLRDQAKFVLEKTHRGPGL